MHPAIPHRGYDKSAPVDLQLYGAAKQGAPYGLDANESKDCF